MITAEQFGFVSDLVRRDAAIVLEKGKEYLVESRLLPLAKESGLPDASAYVAGLMRLPNQEARRKVVEAMTTNETSFFRDTAPFGALSTLVGRTLASRSTDKVYRIWCAACSSGQEPYSIAMQLHDQLKEAGWRLQLDATDINSEMVERSRKGHYSQLEVNRGLPAAHLVRWFQREHTGWAVRRELRDCMRFSQLNLASMRLPGGPYDAIFLRNVLIYFSADTKRQILRQIATGLRAEGALFLGAAETTLGIDDSWERVPVDRSFVYVPNRRGK